MAGKNFEEHQLIKSIPDHLPISELFLYDIFPTKDHILSLFSKLEYLEITVPPERMIDFESIFDCVPLTTLNILCGVITLSPRNLQHLEVAFFDGDWLELLYQTSWKAIRI